MSISTFVKTLNDELASLPLTGRLQLISERFARPVFLSELQPEDQFLTWHLAFGRHAIRVVFNASQNSSTEAKSLLVMTNERYGLAIRAESKLKETVLGPSDVVITAQFNVQDANGEPRFVVWDDAHKIMRINPLADWSENRINEEVSAHEIPVDRTINRMKTDISNLKEIAKGESATIGALNTSPLLANTKIPVSAAKGI